MSEPNSYADANHPDTNFVNIRERSSDYSYDEEEALPIWGVVLIIMAIILILVSVVLYLLIVKDRNRRAVLAASQQVKASDTTVNSEAIAADQRLKMIEEGVLVQPWIDPESTSPLPSFDDDVERQDHHEDDAVSHLTEESMDYRHDNAASSKPKCPICNIPFQKGTLVVASKNPHCGHTFHKTCMFNWLEYQNRCPVCNETYFEITSSTTNTATTTQHRTSSNSNSNTPTHPNHHQAPTNTTSTNVPPNNASSTMSPKSVTSC